MESVPSGVVGRTAVLPGQRVSFPSLGSATLCFPSLGRATFLRWDGEGKQTPGPPVSEKALATPLHGLILFINVRGFSLNTLMEKPNRKLKRFLVPSIFHMLSKVAVSLS